MSILADLRVVVCGLGAMGRGIARVFHDAGAQVTVLDVSEDASRAGLERLLQEASEDGRPIDSLSVAKDLAAAVGDADVFVEAIVEDMAVKRALLADVVRAGPPDLLLVSNTSSLSIGEMGRACGHPERTVGMHFFNPPTKMRLVEVISGAGTSAATTARAVELAHAIGKTPVLCRDSPNFVVNRICRPLYYEAQLLTSQGIEPAVVDAITRGALGHRMGPLELLDFTGLHTHLSSSETALREFGDPRYRPIPVVRGLVRNGMTGRAAGRGFYDYSIEAPKKAIARVTAAPDQPGTRTLAVRGPDAASLSGALGTTTSAEAAEIVVYRCLRAPTVGDVRAVRDLATRGAVVVDSSDGAWLEVLPADAGWIRVHLPPGGGVFAEVVDDEVAGIPEPPFVRDVLLAMGAISVRVLALPGLIADRLVHCMINEATAVVEEGTASATDVDTALTLAMNHPRGPFEQLGALGAGHVLAGLRSLETCTGDPRYRPSQLLRRTAAAASRRDLPRRDPQPRIQPLEV